MTQPADNLDVQQQRTLEAICEVHPVLKQVHRLAQRFVQMIRDRCNEGYDTWLADVAGSDVRYLRTFAEELQSDDAAVRAALISPWSNGQTEGQVNRLKMLKRQMDGRANFDLLRLRVLCCINLQLSHEVRENHFRALLDTLRTHADPPPAAAFSSC